MIGKGIRVWAFASEITVLGVPIDDWLSRLQRRTARYMWTSDGVWRKY